MVELNLLSVMIFLDKYEIKHQLIARYTPQQNEVAKRKNQTLMDIMKLMIHVKNIPKGFQVEAIGCAIYASNRSPIQCNFWKTPQELWTSKKSNISHLQVFDCLAYSNITNVIKKLDDKVKSVSSWLQS